MSRTNRKRNRKKRIARRTAPSPELRASAPAEPSDNIPIRTARASRIIRLLLGLFSWALGGTLLTLWVEWPRLRIEESPDGFGNLRWKTTLVNPSRMLDITDLHAVVGFVFLEMRGSNGVPFILEDQGFDLHELGDIAANDKSHVGLLERIVSYPSGRLVAADMRLDLDYRVIFGLIQWRSTQCLRFKANPSGSGSWLKVTCRPPRQMAVFKFRPTNAPPGELEPFFQIGPGPHDSGRR